MSEMITMDEAVKRYGMSREGLYYHARRGRIHIYRKAGDKKSYVKPSELDAITSFKAVELEEPVKESKELYYPEPEELEEIKDAIAASEDEKAKGFVISHEQLTARIADRLAAYRMRQDRASA